jgi:hypothetical protein
MSDPISDEIFDHIMNVYWEQIACYAYDGYTAAREGLVRVTKAEPDKNAAFHRWALNMNREINTSILRDN